MIFLRSETNVGMGRGITLRATGEGSFFSFSIRHAGSPDAILRLFDVAKDREDIGIAGPKLLNPDGTLQYSCLRFPKVWTPILRRTILGRLCTASPRALFDDGLDHQHMRDVDWMMGSCLLIRANWYRRVGGLMSVSFLCISKISTCAGAPGERGCASCIVPMRRWVMITRGGERPRSMVYRALHESVGARTYPVVGEVCREIGGALVDM